MIPREIEGYDPTVDEVLRATWALVAIAIAACSGGDAPKEVSSTDVAEMERVCRQNGRRTSSRTECIVDAFCRCASLDYRARATDLAEYRSIMSGIESFLDRAGYYCTSRAESECPSEHEEKDEDKDEDKDEREDQNAVARAVKLPPGPAKGLPVGVESAFTIGSPRATVERIQGTPTSVDKILGEVWWYGGSRVEFRAGRVYGWRVGPTELHVTLPPTDPKRFEVAQQRAKFTLGDTKDDVLAIHGVPTELDRTLGETWWYQGSHVEFRNGKVYSWSSADYASLSVYLDPKDKARAETARSRGSYRKDASKDEVLAVEGVPNEVDRSLGETWWYGPSRVEFSNGRLREWSSSPMRPLKLEP